MINAWKIFLKTYSKIRTIIKYVTCFKNEISLKKKFLSNNVIFSAEKTIFIIGNIKLKDRNSRNTSIIVKIAM